MLLISGYFQGAFFAQYCAMDATLLASMSKEDLVAELLRREAENAELKSDKARLESREMELLRRLAELSRSQFGSKSERFVPGDPGQLLLDFGQAMEVARQEAAAEAQTVTYERRKKPRKETPVREALAEDLPRKIVIIEPDFDTTGMIQVGCEVTEVLEYQPGHTYVIQYRRPKYIRATSDEATEIACAQLPPRPIWKGIAGPGLLAWIITEKFLWHIPFHRQWQRFASQGIKVSTSTMGGWFARGCDQLQPIYQELKRIALESRYLQGDETPIKVQDKDKKGATHRGWHWVYHAPDEKIAVFDYQKTRSKAGPTRMLLEYKGWFQTDGYAVYDDFENREDIFLVGCLAHARRYFEKALDNDKARAEWMLAKMQLLYAVERDARERKLDHGQRLDMRVEKSMPLFMEMREWLGENVLRVPPKSAIATAIKYFLGRFEYIVRVCADGRLEIDNNLVENAIRPIAVGRKNYMFAGSHDAARDAALVYTLLGTAKLNGIDPYKWLRDTLAVIDGYPKDRIHELLPLKQAE